MTEAATSSTKPEITLAKLRKLQYAIETAKKIPAPTQAPDWEPTIEFVAVLHDVLLKSVQDRSAWAPTSIQTQDMPAYVKRWLTKTKTDDLAGDFSSKFQAWASSDLAIRKASEIGWSDDEKGLAMIDDMVTIATAQLEWMGNMPTDLSVDLTEWLESQPAELGTSGRTLLYSKVIGMLMLNSVPLKQT